MQLLFLKCKLTLAQTIVFAPVFIHLAENINHYIKQKCHVLLRKVGDPCFILCDPEVTFERAGLNILKTENIGR